jgi:hypothetical protein
MIMHLSKLRILAGYFLISAFFVATGNALVALPALAAGTDACNHPYFPLVAGNEIEYRNSGAGGGSSYVMTIKEAKDGQAKMQYSFGPPNKSTVSMTLTCKDGKIWTDSYMNLGEGTQGVEMTMNTQGVEGALIPADLKVGTTWTTKYSIAATYKGAQVPAGFGGMKMDIRQTNKVVGQEKVTVPAGTYDALKVDVTSSMDFNIPGMPGGSQGAQGTSLTFHEWMAPGVGIVKMSFEGPSGNWDTVATRVNVSNSLLATVQTVAEKGVAPVAVAVGVANTVFAAQATLSVDLWQYLLFFITQPLLLIKRRKRKAWGTVYNSLSRLPEDLVIVRLKDAATDRIVASEVTDKAGRFSFLVNAGQYRLEVAKAGFAFPSQIVKSKEDGQFADVYRGESLKVGVKGGVLMPNIPVDPAHKPDSDASLVKRDYWHKIQAWVALSGPALGTISFIIKPSWLVGVMLALGILVYLFFRRFTVVKAPKNLGLLREAQSKAKVPGAVMRVFAMPYDKMVDFKVTDGRGRYNFVVGNSKFYLTATKQGYAQQKTALMDFSKTTEPQIIADDLLIKKT